MFLELPRSEELDSCMALRKWLDQARKSPVVSETLLSLRIGKRLETPERMPGRTNPKIPIMLSSKKKNYVKMGSSILTMWLLWMLSASSWSPTFAPNCKTLKTFSAGSEGLPGGVVSALALKSPVASQETRAKHKRRNTEFVEAVLAIAIGPERSSKWFPVCSSQNLLQSFYWKLSLFCVSNYAILSMAKNMFWIIGDIYR